MKRVVVVALLLLLAQFLLPVLLLRGQTPVGQETPATLRPAAGKGADRDRTVTLLLASGETQRMSLADYLWGVVAAEMPASFEQEALKAQAVAARTYWVTVSGDKHAPADICSDSGCCQAYISRQEAADNWGTAAGRYGERIANAVAGTDGMILVYQDKPIQAAYFSSAPGRTADAAAVWGNAVPYLVSVPSPEGEEVPNWRNQVTMTTAQFRALVAAQYPEADLTGPVAYWLRDFVWEPSGLVRQVNLGGVTLTGGQIRKLLGLRSACFSVSAEGDELTFQTTGYGHGVGMSQYGANALARQGKGFREILGWYYTGVQVEPLA
ncbi:MAG: stage II sporulation protein D [Ruminococcaceae bacterium]|nr:stage II sporulation protein D [Oscillospiraceae bacterium]